MKTTTRVALLAFCITLLAGCSNNVLSSPDSAVFDGIDPAVVSEVLENPAVRIKVERAPKEIRPGFAQSIAINFIVCRDMLRVYRQWTATGAAPSLKPLPILPNPDPATTAHWEMRYADISASAESGEPEQLRDWLTGDGSHGEWIPARPGDIFGPTIADIVLGAGALSASGGSQSSQEVVS